MNFADLGRRVALTNAIRFRGHEPHTHDEPHLVFVVAGSARLEFDDRTVRLTAHQAAWLPAGVRHGMTVADDGMTIGPLLHASATPPGGVTRVIGPVRVLSDLVTTLLCAAPETDEEREPFRAALGEVLAEISREQFPLTYPEHPVAHAIAIEAPHFEGGLDELARRHFTSVRHVQRLFVEETGLTFARWRTRARLNRAIASLRSGEGMRVAMLESGFATRTGLLKAISRECGLPLPVVLARADAPFDLLDDVA